MRQAKRFQENYDLSRPDRPKTVRDFVGLVPRSFPSAEENAWYVFVRFSKIAAHCKMKLIWGEFGDEDAWIKRFPP